MIYNTDIEASEHERVNTMIQPTNNNEFCIIGSSNFIHVRSAGFRSAKCGANKPRRQGGVVSIIVKCSVVGANDRIASGDMKLCERCAKHTTQS